MTRRIPKNPATGLSHEVPDMRAPLAVPPGRLGAHVLRTDSCAPESLPGAETIRDAVEVRSEQQNDCERNGPRDDECSAPAQEETDGEPRVDQGHQPGHEERQDGGHEEGEDVELMSLGKHERYDRTRIGGASGIRWPSARRCRGDLGAPLARRAGSRSLSPSINHGVPMSRVVRILTELMLSACSRQPADRREARRDPRPHR